MMKIKHRDEIYEVDVNGFLIDSKKWNPNWADYVRMMEGIDKLGDEHDATIIALREHYQKHGSAPLMRLFYKCTNLSLTRAYELFPSGPGKGACKMAGLPKDSSYI
mgnify:FL=1